MMLFAYQCRDAIWAAMVIHLGRAASAGLLGGRQSRSDQ
jgi:hypothetical protein